MEEAASLTRFPHAIFSALKDEINTDVFVPEDDVVAMSYGLTEDDQLRARALSYCTDITAFDEISRVVYEDVGDGTLLKYIETGSLEATVRARDAQTSYKTPSKVGEQVSRAFNALEDSGVREQNEGIDDLDGSTVDRLEELGYV